jgi:hypothetical protein
MIPLLMLDFLGVRSADETGRAGCGLFWVPPAFVDYSLRADARDHLCLCADVCGVGAFHWYCHVAQ